MSAYQQCALVQRPFTLLVLLMHEARSANHVFLGLGDEEYQGGETGRLLKGCDTVKTAKSKRNFFFQPAFQTLQIWKIPL